MDRGRGKQGGGSKPWEKPQQLITPGVIVTGTPEQEAVWDALLNTNKNVIVEAVAGSGKTFTLVQYAMRERMKRIGIVAFNKHIADELKSKMGGQRNVDCMTYHSLGFKAVRQHAGSVQVNQYKVFEYLDGIELYRKQGGIKKLLDKSEMRDAKHRIASMVGFAKGYGYSSDITQAELDWIEDRHDIELNGLKDVVCANVAPALKYCMENLSTIDFDDMVWVPYVLKLPVPQYDVLCVDEYQDTAITQQWLALQSGKRLCAVGDSRQAIYAFRGADSRGFDRLREKLGTGVVTLPLTLTRRCPKSHVELAKTIVPQIRAMEDAPQGKVSYQTEEQAIETLKPGDLVVCRINAPLLNTAYALLKKGTKAVVRGRDIGQGILKLLEQAQKAAEGSSELAVVLANAGTITAGLVGKYLNMPNGRGEMRAAAAQDKFDCMAELGGSCSTVAELKSVLARLFDEFDDDGKPKHAVVLGTVHRTKGLEGNRVYILKPDLIPHPMAKKKADQEQEMNLAYVAVTRAKFEEGEGREGEIVFVGAECPLFPSMQDEMTDELVADQVDPDLDAHQYQDTTITDEEADASNGDDHPTAPEGWGD